MYSAEPQVIQNIHTFFFGCSVALLSTMFLVIQLPVVLVNYFVNIVVFFSKIFRFNKEFSQHGAFPIMFLLGAVQSLALFVLLYVAAKQMTGIAIFGDIFDDDQTQRW